MKTKRVTSLILTAVFLAFSLFFTGCEENKNVDSSTQPSTPTIKDNPLYEGINSCIENIVKADKTNDMEYELKKYPEYYIEGEFGGEKEFEKIVKSNFYTCDTEYEITEITDVTKELNKLKKRVEKNDKRISDIKNALRHPFKAIFRKFKK